MLPPWLDATAQSVGPWWFAEVDPHFTASAARRMLAEGFDYYLPFRLDRRKIRRTRDGDAYFWRDEPQALFPGYLIAAGDAARQWALDAPYRISHISPDAIHPIANQQRFKTELASLEIALYADPRLRITEINRRGQRVKVVAGPMLGVVGYVDEIKNRHGEVVVKIALSSFGGGELTTDYSNLELLPDLKD